MSVSPLTLDLGDFGAPTAPEARRLSYIPVVRCSLVRENSIAVQRRYIRTAADAAAVVAEYLDGADREHFVVLLLDVRSQAVGINTVSIGTLTESLVHPREVFKPAILAGASAIILAHNHPSGDPMPSPEDIVTTRKLREAGKLLGIEVLDHVILGDGRHSSMREGGLLG